MTEAPAQRTGISSLERVLFCLLMICFPLQIRKYIFSPGGFNEWSSFFVYLSDILFFLLCVLWAFRERPLTGAGVWKIFSAKNRPGFFSVLFLVVALCSAFVASSLSLALLGWVHVVEVFLFAWYIKRTITTKEVGTASGFFVAGMVVQAVIGIFQFFMQHDLGLRLLKESELAPALAGVAKIAAPGSPAMIRAYGLFPHPNIFAFFLTVALFLLLYLFFEKNSVVLKPVARSSPQKQTILFGACGGVLLCALLLTFSRVAFAGCVVFLAGFFFTVAAHSRRRDISPKALILTAIFLGVGFLFPAIALRHELADRMNISSEEQSVQLRSYYTAVAEGLIVAHPVLGVGVGHFVASYSDGESPLTYFSRSLPAEKAKDLVVDGMSKGWIYQPVHNLYLLIASETGILGIGLFVAVIVSAVGAFIKKRSTTSQADAPERKILYSIGRTMAFFLLLAFLFHGLFDHFFWTSQQGRLMAGFIFGIFFRFV